MFWDRNGDVVYFKRLERGRSQGPVLDPSRARVELEAAQLAMLLGGIDLNAKRLVVTAGARGIHFHRITGIH